jgi:hypothetical protein
MIMMRVMGNELFECFRSHFQSLVMVMSDRVYFLSYKVSYTVMFVTSSIKWLLPLRHFTRMFCS